MITTDHGRGDTRDGWKSHGVNYPGSDRIWIAIIGPDTPAKGIVGNVSYTQGQVAATVAQLLDRDFAGLGEEIAKPLGGIVEP